MIIKLIVSECKYEFLKFIHFNAICIVINNADLEVWNEFAIFGSNDPAYNYHCHFMTIKGLKHENDVVINKNVTNSISKRECIISLFENEVTGLEWLI